MHFIISPFGSAGDVHPFLGVALALKARGHEITFATNGYFRDLIERFGIEFEELGTREEFLAATQNPDLWHPMRAFKHIFRHLIELGLKQQYELVTRLRRDDSVCVINCFGLGALCAQDKIGIPAATVHLQPSVMWSSHDPPVMGGMFGPRWLRDLQFRIAERIFIDPTVCPALNAYRAEIGLPPVRQVMRWWNSKRGVVCFFPKWFAAPPPDWPPNLIQTGFPLWDEHNGEPLPDKVEAFLAAGTPPLVFTPGSANLFGGAFFEAAAAACASLGRRGILLTRFAEQIPPKLPAGVVHFDYVPFSQLLPRAAAVIHHGGVGSTAQGIAAGVPQLLMPLAHDQFDNAARVKRLGLGDALPQKHFTALRAAAKLKEILESTAITRSCREHAALLSAKDGCQNSASVLVEWAGRQLGTGVRVPSA